MPACDSPLECRSANEIVERPRSFTHEHAAAGNDQRLLGGADGFNGAGKGHLIGLAAADEPDALAEELLRIVVGLGLHILGQGECRRATIGG